MSKRTSKGLTIENVKAQSALESLRLAQTEDEFAQELADLTKVIHDLEAEVARLKRQQSQSKKEMRLGPCPYCKSSNVIVYTSDNDLCNKCGRWFPAGEGQRQQNG